jgi:hypothetical protein
MRSPSWLTLVFVFSGTALLTATPKLVAGRPPEGTIVVRFTGDNGRGRGQGELQLISNGGWNTRTFCFSKEDIPTLNRRIPAEAHVYELDSRYFDMPPGLLAALVADHPEIEDLSLVSRCITDKDLKPLAKLKHLHDLVLGTPRVTAEGLAVLSELHELVEVAFWFGATPVTDDGLKAFRELKNLRVLQLNKTRITAAGIAHLMKLTALEVLDVSGTDAARLKGWPDLPALTNLDLSETDLGDEDLPQLARYPHLRLIYAKKTKLTGKTLDSLAKLERLGLLRLNDSPITDEGVRHLVKLTQLNHFELSGTQVTDACLPHLAGAKAKYIQLGFTKVSEAAGVEFSRKHPKMFISINAGDFVAGKRKLSPGEIEELTGKDRGP